MASVPLLLACTGAVSGAQGAGGDADSTVTHAVVLVERTVDANDGTRAAVSARFARVAAGVTAADTLRAIGAGLELPGRGACASIRPVDTAAGPGSPSDPAPVVELLDLGHVSVEAAGTVTTLVPRQLPYVTDVVTGTVYARAAEGALLPADAAYVVHVDGTVAVPSFDVAAGAPQDPTDVAVAQETTPGKIVAGDAALAFSWPRAGSGAAGDVLYVEVQPAGVRCTLADGSVAPGGSTTPLEHATVPASLLDDSGSLIIHRVHAEPLQVAGVESGELRFDFARMVSYVRP